MGAYSLALPIISFFFTLYKKHFPFDTVPGIISLFAGSLLGYTYGKYQRHTFKQLMILFLLILCIGYSNYFERLWYHYRNFDTFTASVSEPVPDGWKVFSETGKTLTKQDWQGKTIVLDFWNRHCIYCLKSFPIWQRLYNKYKNENIIMKAVNIPFEGDKFKENFEYPKNKGFDFPVVIGMENMDSVFRIKSYPTVVVIRNDKIVFRGSVSEVEIFIDKKY